MTDSTNIGEAEARILERADIGINRALVELHILRGSTSLLDQARAVQLLNELDRYRNSQILTTNDADDEVIELPPARPVPTPQPTQTAFTDSTDNDYSTGLFGPPAPTIQSHGGLFGLPQGAWPSLNERTT